MTVNVFSYKEFGDIKAAVDIDRCDGCAFCLDVCPFKAIRITKSQNLSDNSYARHIVINRDLCQGCGMCQGTCPKQAVYVEGFKYEQIIEKIGESLK